MKITGIHHIAIKVKPDLFQKVVSFYTELLNLKIVRSWGEGEYRAVMASTGDNSCLEIMSDPEAGEVPSEGSLRHIALSCRDCEGYASLMKEKGFEIIIGPKEVAIPSVPPYNVKICFVKGAAGEIIEFFEEM
ncbi:MAG: VOC family protein [Clostridiales bacterium]|jgi:glyoxylase I family protein|nr:VOC family protein [Clostridiales bacterium]